MLSDKEQQSINLKIACRNRYNHKHKEALSEKRRLKRANYTAEEKKRQVDYSRKYYQENKARLDVKSREYALKNKEKVKAINKTYREKNKEKILADKAEKRRDPKARERERIVNLRYSRKNSLLLQSKRRAKYKEDPEPIKEKVKKSLDKFLANEPSAYDNHLKSNGEQPSSSCNRRNHRRLWEDKEDLLVHNRGDKTNGFNLSDAEISLILHRTRRAITIRRYRIGKKLQQQD